ncbi:MAG: acetyl-CoA carboxylase biotin carboxyl carrier protein subunit [Chloroflexota bacterium]|nr:MAG: acetyl-CoA carboxylase biotin carboxyl carrier protein subunit [Chloroflexota bacterium]
MPRTGGSPQPAGPPQPDGSPARAGTSQAMRVTLAPPSVHAGLEPITVAPDGTDGRWLVDDTVSSVSLEHSGPGHSRLTIGDQVVQVLQRTEFAGRGAVVSVRREVLIGGWRVVVEVEPAARADLRARARRSRVDGAASGPTEVRAMIPGVVVAVPVAAGDRVIAGQKLAIIEAMKMQNEVLAPRDGVIERVSVHPGARIELGDPLMVIN